MTEHEWLHEPDFARHVQYIEDRLSDRRQRLLSVAFCRSAWHLFDHPTLREAVDTAECYADGTATGAELEAARQRCRVIAVQAHESWAKLEGAQSLASLGQWLLSRIAWAAAFASTTPVSLEAVGNKMLVNAVERQSGESGFLVRDVALWDRLMNEQRLRYRALVWDVAGNPFTAAAIPECWRSSTVVALAAQMYQTRDFAAMPILADALEDAGCDCAEVLDHSRKPGVHWRGCWVVDRILKKE